MAFAHSHATRCPEKSSTANTFFVGDCCFAGPSVYIYQVHSRFTLQSMLSNGQPRVRKTATVISYSIITMENRHQHDNESLQPHQRHHPHHFPTREIIQDMDDRRSHHWKSTETIDSQSSPTNSVRWVWNFHFSCFGFLQFGSCVFSIDVVIPVDHDEPFSFLFIFLVLNRRFVNAGACKAIYMFPVESIRTTVILTGHKTKDHWVWELCPLRYCHCDQRPYTCRLQFRFIPIRSLSDS